LLAGLGAGAIITNTSGEGAVSAPGLTVNKSVVTDGLIALYNSLKFELTEVSGSFGLFNSYRTGVDYNAQIVGDTSSTFPSGVGIAYLEGITRHSSDDPTSYSSIGSFIRLPDKKEFQDLFYSQKGATIDVWLHMPNLNEAGGGFDSAEASGLYRILLANENTGITTGFDHGTDIHNMKWVNTNETVKGLMIGFTRDRRLTLSLSASNDSADNPAANSCFFIAPTQAYDNSSIGLLFNSNKPCDDGKVYQGLTIPVSSTNSDVSLSSCGEEFCHLSMVFDSTKKIINVYLDGVLINTSKYIDVFGKDRISDIPSLIKTGTFEYESDGPSLDSYFTPWIVGGGYTDGMGTGNFMGGLFGGIISGLKGFVGSLKFYSKPLTGAEVLQNYKANKGFFKNIDLG
jgi:hypothetical protein